MSTRQRIADALGGVSGINADIAPPDVLAPGAAWPAWVSATRGTYTGLTNTWHVLVVLPNANMQQTVEGADPLVDAIWAALLDVGDVSIVEAAMLTQTDPGGVGQATPGLRFTMTTTGSKT